MPYPPNHHRDVKKKIIDSARRLFNRHGFESVSITHIRQRLAPEHFANQAGASPVARI